jgi:hypothetical protein
VVDVCRLGTEEVLAVEGPPEVPVGGVEEPHDVTVTATTDRTSSPRGACGGPGG